MKDSQSFKNALHISAFYLIFGMVWIYSSDTLIELFSSNIHQVSLLQTYKGLFFIGVTAILLYLLIYRVLQDRYNEYKHYIDEQKIVQQQLTQQDALLNSLIDSSPDAIVIKRMDRRYIVFNKGASKFSGVPTKEAIGKTADEIFPFQTANIINAIDDDLLENDSFIEHEETMQMPNGETYIYWVTKGLLKTENGEIFGIFGIYRDITSEKSHEKIITDEKERFDFMAHHDPLTGLPNRLSLIEMLQIRTAETPILPFMLMYVDLDGFKEINDSFGHRFGDQILIFFSHLLRDLFPKETLIIRTGGDEFVVVMESSTDKYTAQKYLDRLIQILNDPFTIEQIEVYITASIGISVFPDDALNYEELLQKADAAMYKAKNSGRNTYSFYNDGLTQEVLERTTLASNLKKAISNNNLTLYYQPQVDLNSGKIYGAEALVRWFSSDGAIPPSQFIPIAEERGLIFELGAFVLHEGFASAARWANEGRLNGRVAINVSAKQLIHPTFLVELETILLKTRCNPNWIEIEITESSILEYPERIIALLGDIKSKGFKISIDDFGTGYSSLSYLKHLPVDKLKIDISFIRNITKEPKNQTIVKTIIALAQGLGMTTLAEGVESADELDFLRACGVDFIQGYYYYKPMDVQSVELLFDKINSNQHY
jgi:diguanylate cyclase (GGDEF)-like protein/PAS domain S-box-containing protein